WIAGIEAGENGGGGRMYLGTVSDSTIDGNTAGNFGVGVDAGALLIVNTTGTNNFLTTTDPRAGAWIYIFSEGVQLRNSILAYNFANYRPDEPGNTPVAADLGSVFGWAADVEHTLIMDTESANALLLSHGVNGNIIGLDPQLDVLAYYGGLTLTRALLPSSPAIDAGANAWVSSSTDQRGESRISNGRVDMGAFEYQVVPDVIVIWSAPEEAIVGEVLRTPLVVRAQDTHGVGAAGVEVTLSVVDAPGTVSGTFGRTTGADGRAVFDDLVFEDAGDYQLQAAAPGLPTV